MPDELAPTVAPETPATEATEAQPTTPAETDPVVEGQETQPTAPESYEDFKLPEGLTVNPDMLGDFVPVAKELGLTQEAAQKLVDLQAKYAQVAADQSAKAWESTLQEWATALEKDPEIGGDKKQQSVAGAQAAMKALGNSSLAEAMDATGMGNHPEMIRLLNNVYTKFLKEDSTAPVQPRAAEPEPKSRAQTLFPSMTKKD